MSQENVEIVRSVYEAVNRGDWDAAWRDLHRDVELTMPPEPGITPGTYRGRDEWKAFREEMLTAFEDFEVQPEAFIENGDQVVVIVRTRLRPKGSSAEVQLRNGDVWTLRDGKALSVHRFRSPQEALEAVEQDAQAES
jgi:uncharacterized protein